MTTDNNLPRVIDVNELRRGDRFRVEYTHTGVFDKDKPGRPEEMVMESVLSGFEPFDGSAITVCRRNVPLGEEWITGYSEVVTLLERDVPVVSQSSWEDEFLTPSPDKRPMAELDAIVARNRNKS